MVSGGGGGVGAGSALGGAGPNYWEQFQSAQAPSQHAPRSLYLYVLERVDYNLARGPLRRGAQLGAIGPIGLRPALGGGVCVCVCVCEWGGGGGKKTKSLGFQIFTFVLFIYLFNFIYLLYFFFHLFIYLFSYLVI